VAELCRRRFGSETVALLGRLHHPALFPGLVAWEAGERVGALSVFTDESGAEVVLLAADRPGWGGSRPAEWCKWVFPSACSPGYEAAGRAWLLWAVTSLAGSVWSAWSMSAIEPSDR